MNLYDTCVILVVIILLAFILLNRIKKAQDDWQEQIKKSNPQESDTKQEKILKLEKINLDTGPDIGWMRDMFISIAIGFFACLILLNRMPYFYELIISIMAIFMIIYFTNSWFNAHGNQTRRNRIHTLTTALKVV